MVTFDSAGFTPIYYNPTYFLFTCRDINTVMNLIKSVPLLLTLIRAVLLYKFLKWFGMYQILTAAALAGISTSIGALCEYSSVDWHSVCVRCASCFHHIRTIRILERILYGLGFAMKAKINSKNLHWGCYRSLVGHLLSMMLALFISGWVGPKRIIIASTHAESHNVLMWLNGGLSHLNCQQWERKKSSQFSL